MGGARAGHGRRRVSSWALLFFVLAASGATAVVIRLEGTGPLSDLQERSRSAAPPSGPPAVPGQDEQARSGPGLTTGTTDDSRLAHFSYSPGDCVTWDQPTAK